MTKCEIFPFTKFSWRSKANEREWEPLRRRIYDTVYYAEYEMVKRGQRKCDVYDFGPNNILPRLKKPALDGLHFLPMLISQQYGGYGHRHYVQNSFGENSFIYGVVSKELDDAVKFHDAGVVDVKDRIKQWSDMNPNGIDHHVTGELLGYPECCTEWFCRVWLQDGSVDPMYEMALNTPNHEVDGNTVSVEGIPNMNRLARYWGYNMIPFFPHSYDCQEAMKFSDKFYALMKEKDKEAAEACQEVLSMPMTWSMTNCITTLDHPLFYGSANGYYRPETVTVHWFPK